LVKLTIFNNLLYLGGFYIGDLMVSVTGLFVGCGGLDLGFKNAGYDLAWANDIELDACATYRQNVHSEVISGDIWELMDEVPKTDVIIGGPPCQAFSLVGKRAEDDPRAKLVFAYAKIIEKNKPKAFVMENVPGLAASKVNGKRLTTELAEQFYRLGYHVEILKLKAVDFFVPQKRQRVVLIGYKPPKKTSSLSFLNNKEFLDALGAINMAQPVSAKEALDDLPKPLEQKSFDPLRYRRKAESGYSQLMRLNSGYFVSCQIMPTMSEKDRAFVKHIPPGGNYTNIPDEISTTRILKFKESGGRTTTYGRLHPDNPAYTINTYFNRPNVGANYHYSEERLITPREALRLQSFSDDFEPFFKSQRSLHMQIGNAVPPLMAQGIAEALKGVLNW
jgi:DNA (cytosine-5)-methyltransferase 1